MFLAGAPVHYPMWKVSEVFLYIPPTVYGIRKTRVVQFVFHFPLKDGPMMFCTPAFLIDCRSPLSPTTCYGAPFGPSLLYLAARHPPPTVTGTRLLAEGKLGRTEAMQMMREVSIVLSGVRR